MEVINSIINYNKTLSKCPVCKNMLDNSGANEFYYKFCKVTYANSGFYHFWAITDIRNCDNLYMINVPIIQIHHDCQLYRIFVDSSEIINEAGKKKIINFELCSINPNYTIDNIVQKINMIIDLD